MIHKVLTPTIGSDALAIFLVGLLIGAISATFLLNTSISNKTYSKAQQLCKQANSEPKHINLNGVVCFNNAKFSLK